MELNLQEKRMEQLGIESATSLMKKGVSVKASPEMLVKGPNYIDSLERGWCFGDMIGVIAGSGTGKTSMILNFYKDILLNNPDKIGVFFAMEMSQAELLDKWSKLTNDLPEISDRFYIETNYDKEGRDRNLTMDKIKEKLKIYNENVAKVAVFTLDHLHICRRREGETLDDVVYKFSSACKESGALGFLTSQTTKNKSGMGDIPLDKTACYGTSAFEWESTYIITLSQPLKRVQSEIDLPITAWQYAKIRFKDKGDKYKESINYLLYYDYETESYRKLNVEELSKFDMWYEKVLEMRDAEEKKKAHHYDTSYTVKNREGKEVRVSRLTGDREI